GCGLAGRSHVSQKKAGKAEANLSVIRLGGVAGGIVGKVEAECARPAVAIYLVRTEVAAEREIVSAFRPGHAVAGDPIGAGKIPLEGVADKRLAVAIHGVPEGDQGEIRGTCI